VLAGGFELELLDLSHEQAPMAGERPGHGDAERRLGRHEASHLVRRQHQDARFLDGLRGDEIRQVEQARRREDLARRQEFDDRRAKFLVFGDQRDLPCKKNVDEFRHVALTEHDGAARHGLHDGLAEDALGHGRPELGVERRLVQKLLVGRAHLLSFLRIVPAAACAACRSV
jgi:hypothetical protein